MYSSQDHHVISSSDDEVTVVPMKLIRSNLLILPEPPDDPNSYKELHKYSMEQCEFCDSIFHCRYDVVIHNAKHIIVPLINQTTYKCNICLHVFTSEQELNIHKYCKHTNVTPQNGQQSFFKGTDVKHKNENVPKVLENFVGKEPIVKCDDSVTMLVNSSNNLKNRLVFEDEDDDVICLDNKEPSSSNSGNFDTNVNTLILDIVNNKLKQTLNGVHSSKGIQNATPKLKVLLPSQVNLEKLPPSVHFKQLLKPGLYRCKRCTKTFPNRYSLILHETKHMKFKKQIDSHLCIACDRHTGSREALNNHIRSFHPTYDLSKNWTVSVCHECKLQFHNSKRHAMLYHKTFMCNYCKTWYLTSYDLSMHQNECSKSYQALFKTFTDNQMEKKSFQTELEDNFDILKVCEVCALFLKDRQHIKYICVGENSKLECDQVCEWCGKEAYVIKLIKRVRVNVKFKGQQKARTLSNNENRLKNIQQRLKLMNKLSRF